MTPLTKNTDRHARKSTPSPAPDLVADGIDIHTGKMQRLYDRLHARQDPYCAEREALETMVDMCNENHRRVYCVDRDPDDLSLAFVTLEHRQDIAVVQLDRYVVQIEEHVANEHHDLVHTLDWIGYDIHTL